MTKFLQAEDGSFWNAAFVKRIFLQKAETKQVSSQKLGDHGFQLTSPKTFPPGIYAIIDDQRVLLNSIQDKTPEEAENALYDIVAWIHNTY